MNCGFIGGFQRIAFSGGPDEGPAPRAFQLGRRCVETSDDVIGFHLTNNLLGCRALFRLSHISMAMRGSIFAFWCVFVRGVKIQLTHLRARCQLVAQESAPMRNYLTGFEPRRLRIFQPSFLIVFAASFVSFVSFVRGSLRTPHPTCAGRVSGCRALFATSSRRQSRGQEEADFSYK